MTPRLQRLSACLTLLIAATAAASSQSVATLTTHEQRPWPVPAGLERVAIADPTVADFLLLKGNRQALLVGKKPGQTTLLLWTRGHQAPQRVLVNVRNPLQAQLSGRGHTQLQVHDGEALIQGSTPTLLDHAQTIAAARDAVGAKGSVSDQSTVASGGVVQVDVKVVEFDKTALRQIGLSFKAGNNGFSYSLGGPGSRLSGNGAGNDVISSAFNLVLGHTSANGRHLWNANLDLLQSDGLVRVLAEPTLVALSGQSASFLSGGELPIPVPQGLGTTTIVYKPFGIGLTVTPTVLAPNRIALKVAPEASDLDYTNAVSLNGVSVPAITTRRADTTVELGDGETFIVGGLVSQSINSQVDKVPLLGDIPILGAFFRDLKYSRTDKELVIMVTPHLVQPLMRNARLPLPGEREVRDRHAPVWGAWLLDPAGKDQLPGFSR
ncbi:MAG: type II and III secretion system protein family protein [Dyella sp.]|uniref:type II and III secretion system protein family protein n=1 Tax=Dyella sp. TaxID=1869338 RepID=UPI003F80F303